MQVVPTWSCEVPTFTRCEELRCLHTLQAAGRDARRRPPPASVAVQRRPRAPPGMPRQVYIDAGANWANTLRLFRDLSPAAASEPWEVYAFEASPLILPYLEEFTRWLSSGSSGTAPTSCLPTSGSTDDLLHWSRAGIGCPEHSMDAMRAPAGSVDLGENDLH